MTPESLQLYKLIILYFLNQADQPMPNAILSDFILETGYTDYLSIQQTLSELTEDAMILVDQTHEKSYYTIAEIGKETLRFFGNQLPTVPAARLMNILRRTVLRSWRQPPSRPITR